MSWTTAKIRQSFLDLFPSSGHTIVPPPRLIPKEIHPAFVNADGPVKDYFRGVSSRSICGVVVDVQKCLRIRARTRSRGGGRTSTHHTFFEMLGNWSFGDLLHGRRRGDGIGS